MLEEEKISRIDSELLEERYQDRKELEEVLEKIRNGYPVQYAIGNVPFLNNIIKVDERVLIPRFATELLVSKTIDYIKEKKLGEGPFVDICTGSGCIAIALRSEFKNSSILAIDVSDDALEVARMNALTNKVEIGFLKEDILKTDRLDRHFSLIIANPPYVKSGEVVSLNTKYEPKIALYPGKDDVIFYKKIIDLANESLLERAMIAFEIGSTQAKEIGDYVKNVMPQATISIEKDYEGYDRFLFIFKNC
ncbi:MAG TPA: peptide chain release factor N(5)-glutamine methyltransferase [Firmicutes bacterium]|nr:peptide chain release factor N(5)-glutamine methyltransferase [Bacillota bacterium]